MEKVLDIDTYLKKMKIKDLNNRDFEIKDLASFVYHIKTFHSHGISLHEENGFFLELMINSGNFYIHYKMRKQNENFFI